MSFFCNKCGDYVLELNELELEELEKNGSFVCSDCINDEMDAPVSKFVLTIPHKKGSQEWKNCFSSLQEICEDNEGYAIQVMEECEECGSLNDTVSPVISETETRYLCDHCVKE